MADSKLIAKNTLLLYFRMIFNMLISLYTSRVILNALGVEDFGIYNVVGGVVIMFGFLHNAMAASTERFIAYGLGKGNDKKLSETFSLSVSIHVTLSIIVFILLESIGVWFLNSKLNIPATRIVAANWVFQFSIFTSVITIISVPYNALIIAHEHMQIFAYVSILEVVLKLLSVFSLLLFKFDRLILYSILTFSVALLLRILYGSYCSKKFREAKYHFFWDASLFKEMLSFASWNLLGVFAGIGYNQGVNILLNIFFGPIVNAARGIAFQVMGAVNQLVTNFQIAVNPPIVKSYANNENDNMYKLIFASSKYSFFLLLLFIIPLIIETPLILRIWLKKAPLYTDVFVRLILIDVLVCSISGPLQMLAQATGKVKKYQLVVSIILLLNLPISYFLLKFGLSPNITFEVSILLSVFALAARLIILKSLVNFPIKAFIQKVIFIVFLVGVLTTIPPLIISMNMLSGIIQLLSVSGITLISAIVFIWFIGLSVPERNIARGYFSKWYSKLFAR